MDRGAWQVTAHVVTKESDMTKQLNNSKQRLQQLYKVTIITILILEMRKQRLLGSKSLAYRVSVRIRTKT